MIAIRKICIKDIPELLEDSSFWKHSFLSISKHRLFAHFKNPNAEGDDVVLLLAYLDSELVGYMGVFIDRIILNGIESKIGWLSTWWVHPKTKGTGIGREILNTMYNEHSGKIGISQFTPSAKRVYDKSGFFNTLKENSGMKAVLRSNLAFVIPVLYSPAIRFKPLLKRIDFLVNSVVNCKLNIQKTFVKRKLKNISLDYLNNIDNDVLELIKVNSSNHISPKGKAFFEWLKAYQWVQESPLLELTNKNQYEFSMYDSNFNIYLIKIIENDIPIGFLVLQRRNYVCKVLFAYYDTSHHAEKVSEIIKLQCINQNVREIICYDEAVLKEFRKSSIFLYKTKKKKQSIISKKFNQDSFENVVVNFGDGDCCFA